MASKLYEFLNERYNAYPLMLATEKSIPGMLLEADWRRGILLDIWPTKHPEFRREEGFAWELLEQPEQEYESEMVDANIIQQSVNDKINPSARMLRGL